MQNPNRRIQSGALLAGLAIGALVAAPNSGFAWPMAGGSSTRDHRITSSPQPLPPLTIKGRYFDGGFSGSQRIFLIDGNYLFDSGNLGVAAYDLVDQPDGDGVLSEESRWRYPAEGEFGRLFQPTTQLDGNRVYLSEEVVDFVGPETVEMVRVLALSRHNGTVEWDHVIEHARYGKLLLQHNRVYLWHQDRTVESGNPFNGRLVALEPDTGDEFASTATLFSNESIPLIVSGGLVYLDEGRRISAFNADTLDLEWTYPEGDQPIPGTGEENISNMAFSDGVLYFLYGGQRLFAIDDEGTLLWETDMVEGENCTARGNLAIADDAVLVSRVCFDRLYAVDRETGDVSWSREVEGEYQNDAPLVSNGMAIVGTSGTQFESGDTQIIDVASGEIVSTISYPEMISGRVKAARNGLLYMEASLVGTEVTVVEMEPATLKTSMEGFPDLDCGLYVGQEMSGTVRFTNEGPGLARNTFAIIRDENNSLDVTVDVPDGLDLFESGTGIYRLNLGDVEPGTELEVPVTISPNRPGLVNITTSFVSSVRNPAEEDMADQLRIPALAVPDQPANLEIAAVEVTQGMQDLDGSIEFAARKPTLVRVYPESDVDIESLNISLIASRSILDAPTEIEPLETCLAVEAGAFDREDLSRSFNFLLPNRLLFNEHGEPVTLEITLDPTEGLDLVDRSAAQETVEVYYNTTSPICLLTYAVKTEDSEGEILIPSSRLPENVRERAEAMLPAPEIRAYRRSTVISKGIVRSEPYNLDIGDSARFVRESRVVSKLWLQRTTSSVPHDCDRDDASVHYLGIVGEDVYTSPDVSGRFNGFANMPGSALLVRMRDLEASGLNSPLAGVTLAHELGHNFGRTHVDCGGPAAAWSNIPYDPCTLGPVGDSTSFFGVDLLDPTDPELVVPREADHSDGPLADLMSYAGTRWTSDYTWRGVHGKLSSSVSKEDDHFFANRSSFKTAWLDGWKSETGNEILIYATLGGEGDDGDFLEILSLDRNFIPGDQREKLAVKKMKAFEEDSPYVIELLDQAGEVLLSVPADIHVGADFGDAFEQVSALVPDLPDLAELRLAHVDDGPLFSRHRPDGDISVELLAPAGGEQEDEFIVVDWQIEGGNSDDLTAMIQYSHNSGDTWETLLVGLEEGPYPVAAEFLPGGIDSALIRVVVTDGFNSGYDTSQPFTIIPRDPIVTITAPNEGQQIPSGMPVYFRATAFDPEDGHLDGEAVQWALADGTHSGDGRQGFLTGLPIGEHELVVTVVDSDGNQQIEAVTFEVIAREATRDEVLGHLLEIMTPEGVNLDRNEDGVIDSGDLHE